MTYGTFCLLIHYASLIFITVNQFAMLNELCQTNFTLKI